MAFVSHTAKQWPAGHRKEDFYLLFNNAITPPTPTPRLSSSFLNIPFLPLLSPLFLSLLLGLSFFVRARWVWRRWGLLFGGLI